MRKNVDFDAIAAETDMKAYWKNARYAARSNPVFACPKCGSSVRLGAGGGLFDTGKRTAHKKVCGTDGFEAIPEEVYAARREIDPPSTKNSACADCGFLSSLCKC